MKTITGIVRRLGALALGAACISDSGVSVQAAAVPQTTMTTTQSPDAPRGPLRAIPFTQVRIRDRFWAPRQETNRTVSIPHSLRQLEKVGNIRDLELAASGARSGYMGPVFIDSDLYKALEAVSYALAAHPDAELEAKLDAIIAKIAAAQWPDGYLNTWYQVNAPEKRWTNLRDDHELYCAGHLFEAAAAHYQATGKRTLLDVAARFADHIDSVFGEGEGKRMGYCGHPEIELALFKLGRVTGEKRYLDLARFFIESRGSKFFATEHGIDPEKYDGGYWQDNVPIRGHRHVIGHAVRMVYLMAGATDLAAMTGDPGLIGMLDRVWRNTTERNMYVTGGIGSSAANEGFTVDYDLPNFSAYQETCASVAMVMWAHRLNLLHGDARYADAMERSLYNGVLAGVSLDGTRFFYVNPLASRGNHHRKEWYGCACCPPNVTRTLAQLGGYACAVSPGALWVNLYAAGSIETELDGKKVALAVATDYPWDGTVRLSPKPDSPSRFQLRLRVPGWCSGESVRVNGTPVENPVRESGYIVLDREWKSGDEVVLDLPMPVRRIAAHPHVKENTGRLAIQRGPLVYCLEGVDHEAEVHRIALAPDAPLTPEHRPDLLGGVVVLKGEGTVDAGKTDWTRRLYAPAPETTTVAVTAVPYYAWDNRAAGDMAVWIPVAPPPPASAGPEARARISMSFVSFNCQPEGIRDGIEPARSSDQPALSCHWWPHKGSEEWVQYTWPQALRLAGARIYWFDDTGRGECRVPESWRIEYRDGGQWKPVQTAGPCETALDRWCEVEFEPVRTRALRLVVQMKPGYAAGVHEWRILESPDGQ